MPLVTHFTEDETWGKENGSRKVMIARNLLFREGEWATDITRNRIENQYWKWELCDFKQNNFGFSRFTGEWRAEDLYNGNTRIFYTYTLHSSNGLMRPFHWLFTKTIWRMYMKHAMENIRQLAENGAEYLYD